MPEFRTTISRAWVVAFAIFRFGARLGIGLLGVYWFIGGVIAAVTLPFVGVWEGAAGAILYAFIGWSLAYGAFKWWPWEARPRPEQSGGTH
jgi:hypothetical protein